MKILKAQQIKDWDQYTIVNEPISSFELMNRAGEQLFEYIARSYNFQHYTIVCGNGNNGGDGLVIAQLLYKHQFEVSVIILKGNYSDECKMQLKLSSQLSIPITEIENSEQIESLIFDSNTCIIDAIFGIGISRPVDGLAAQLIQRINSLNAYTIAIDLPSGLSPDCKFESNINNTIKANETLSIQLPKLAFMFPENDLFVGKFHLIDIGLSKEFISNVSDECHYLDEKMLEQLILPRPVSAHKGTFGHALLIAGSSDKVGAAILSAKAAMRSGCGLLTVLLPDEASVAMNCTLPEAMIIKPQLASKIEFEKYNAIAIGPGLGKSQEIVNLLTEVLNHYTQPLVIDADAINIIASNKELMEKLNTNCILTPHPKEFDRLTKNHVNAWERFLTQKEWSKKHKITIVLKGHHTSITTFDGKVYFNSTGNNGMATAGAGDVLTGILLALCAQNYKPVEATKLGVFLHGFAGDQAAYHYSKTALIASDIINSISDFFKRFEK